MLFFGLFSYLLIPVGIVILIVTLVRHKGTPPPSSYNPYNPYVAPDWQLQQRNQEWIQFIEGYDHIAKTPAEKQLVRHMLYDAAMQGLGKSQIANQYLGAKAQPLPDASLTPPLPQQTYPAITPAYPTLAHDDYAYAPPEFTPSQPIDNSSLLLYFGAFLFVASVGLFIAFGGASGAVRTVAVLLVMAVMYGGGLWLFKTKPKLQQAGLAFAAIGIVIAPLVGLAFYEYIFTKHHAALVWLLTSLFCMALYTHALIRLKKPLISYVLIFTFLSLFESGVSIASAPVYYFGWGMAFVGIILQLLSWWKGYYPELRESSRYSALFLLPISILASLVLLPKQGSGQLGVSLLLAAAFYGLEALNTKHREQEANAILSQSALIVATACLVYAMSHRWILVVVGLLVANALQVLVMVLANVRGQLWQNFGSVLLTASVADVMLAVGKPESLVAATAGAVGVGLIIWWRQRRADAYGVAALAFMALPYLYGQVTAKPAFNAGMQTILALMALLVLLLAYLGQYSHGRKVAGWTVTAEVSYALGAASVAFASCFASPLLCLNVAIGIAASMVLMGEHTKRHDWVDASAVFLAVPIVRGWFDQPVLLAALLVALVAFIALSLRYRREFLRWASTLIWLVLPFGLGRGVFQSDWSPAAYAWAYMAVMIALLISRSVARGVLFFSSKTPLAAYARSASLSYSVGYVTAACLALGFSLASHQSQVHSTVILGVLMLVTVLVSIKIEKRPDLLSLLPLLAQGLLLSAVRPHPDGTRLTLFLLASTALAAATYLFVATAPQPSSKKQAAGVIIRQASLIMAFVTPAFGLLFGRSDWPMPLGLLIAGLLLCHAIWKTDQTYRELAGAVITVSALWFLGQFHVTAVQAYVHVIVANLALYAYWRARRGDQASADGYLWAMIATATTPLAIQALAGAAGGLYGWWLLLEQVVFMLLGMAIKRRFVTFWGLYVALGAVLFQLRHLGWAALTVLALFLIGIAVYQLQKHNDTN